MKWPFILLMLVAQPALAAHTMNGVIYGTASGIVRRVIVPDDDRELATATGPGESMVMVQATDTFSLNDVNGYVAQAIGKQPPSARCVVTDAQGNVVATLEADPVLDKVSGFTISLNATATIGSVVAVSQQVGQANVAQTLP